MYIVAVTDETHELRIYEYPYETLEEAEKHYDMEQFSCLLIEVNGNAENIIKCK